VFGVEAGEIMASVQVAMIAGLPYTALRDAIFTHPTLLEGLIRCFQPSRANKLCEQDERDRKECDDHADNWRH
jgi:hypothetical protein